MQNTTIKGGEAAGTPPSTRQRVVRATSTT